MTQAVYLRIGEVEKHLGVGKTTVYKLIKQGLIEKKKFGAASRVNSDSLDSYIASCPST